MDELKAEGDLEEGERGAGSAGTGTPAGQPCPVSLVSKAPDDESLQEEVSACDFTSKASAGLFLLPPTSQPLFPSLRPSSGPTCHKRLPPALPHSGGSQLQLSR